MAATVTCDFGTLAAQPNWYRWMGNSHIWIRDPAELGQDDWDLLAAIPIASARCFVRLEQWAENNWQLSDGIGGLATDPQPNFTLGDSWITELNSHGIPIQIIHEGLSDLTWMTVDSANFAAADLDTYEDLLYTIYTHIKTAAPNTVYTECLNEPFLAINGNFDGAQVFELMRRNANAVTRVNADSLPGPAMKTGGPAATITQWENGQVEQLVDTIATNSTVWDTVIKPVTAFWSGHTFQNTGDVNRIIDGLQDIDTYVAASSHPTMLDGIPRTMSAYSRESNVSTTVGDGYGDDEDPSAVHMARGVCFYQSFHYFAHEYKTAAGDAFAAEPHTMFAFQNYVDYGTSFIRPNELPANHQVGWAATPGARTPYYNLADLETKVAAGAAAQRCSVSGTGSDWWENDSAPAGRGVVAEPLRPVTAGSGKVWVFLSRHKQNQASSTNVTVELAGLASAGIDPGQTLTFNEWIIDTNHSNIGNGAANSTLEQTTTNGAVTAGATPSFTIDMIAPAVHLLEIVGTATGAAVTNPTTATATGQTANATAVTASTLTAGAATATATGLDAVAVTAGTGTPGRIITASTASFNTIMVLAGSGYLGLAGYLEALT